MIPSRLKEDAGPQENVTGEPSMPVKHILVLLGADTVPSAADQNMR